jgi:hypothetical protein
MKNRLLAALVVALAFCVVNTRATDGFGLPTELPIGSRQQMLEWQSTNQNSTIAVVISFTNTANQLTNRGISSPLDGLRFTSYTAYKQVVVTNANALYNTYRSTMSPSSTLKVEAKLIYITFGAVGFSGVTNLGLASLVTSNSFWKIEPEFVQAVVPLPNINFFEVEVTINEGRTYNYTWTPSGGVSRQNLVPPNPYPPEPTALGKLILNEWYSIGGARARFRIGNAAMTNHYTQFGERLVGKKLTATKGSLSISIPKGADVGLQSSTNFSTWQTVANFPSSLGTNMIVVPLDSNKSLPQQYFRTILW